MIDWLTDWVSEWKSDEISEWMRVSQWMSEWVEEGRKKGENETLTQGGREGGKEGRGQVIKVLGTKEMDGWERESKLKPGEYAFLLLASVLISVSLVLEPVVGSKGGRDIIWHAEREG